MYQYDDYDRQVVRDRVGQFKGQMARYLSGEMAEELFLPLRLQNGLYLQKHAPMLRVAVPYGILSAPQLRRLAEIARRYDRGYCHVTTRQNLQFNWITMEQVPAILESLLEVEMHAIQTSGNCIRNTTTDPFAGVAADEVVDPRPYCEIIRQWSTVHPEFAFLPRKFKVAVTGASTDRAAIRVHDIGLRAVRDDRDHIGFEVWVGGGLGRTPMLGSKIRSFLPRSDLLAYLKAVLRVYNRYGRRDNKYKARIKILVKSLGHERFKEQVETEFAATQQQELRLTPAELQYAESFFSPSAYERINVQQVEADLWMQRRVQPLFDRWVKANVHPHRVPGYAAVTLSLKAKGQAPGDIHHSQLDGIAELAERFCFGEVRTAQQQNIVLPDVAQSDLLELWQQLTYLDLASPTQGTAADIVCCPGADFCNLANARSLPVNDRIQARFADLDRLHNLGPISIRIAGCINACTHHHIANIGILGVEKSGQEYYQITLGGESGDHTRLGKVIGPALPLEAVADAVERMLELYLQTRQAAQETFAAVVERLGVSRFKEVVYAANH
ncbi:nitrite/sulfite reductase [Motiliproteus sediminis]|uniref:nitrite/sulfite reductase n=1 Tax=Motiliproteus sediminis TaxID=1468178 RepID=UPI001AEFDA76|nr:nitrite/sulfite reductase [Motiliproteus sediminis]